MWIDRIKKSRSASGVKSWPVLVWSLAVLGTLTPVPVIGQGEGKGAGPGSTRPSGSGPGQPATAAEAAQILDLAKLPLVENAERLTSPRLASLSYNAPGAVTAVFAAQRKQLLDLKWTELPNSQVSDQSASATFTRKGFSVSLMAYPLKPGVVNVSLLNHGNVELSKLPVPAGAKPFYGGPVNVAYLTSAPVAETAEACRKSLLEAGWNPYGDAGDTRFFKQNAVRLAARVSSAPAQEGKTFIDYSTLLMSYDLPAPAETEGLQYADTTGQLLFDTRATEAEIVDFYRQALAGSFWKSTTKSANKIDFKNVLIFANPQKDLLTLEMFELPDRKGTHRIALKHQTAAEVATIDRRIKAQIDKLKREQDTPLPKLIVTLPRDAAELKQTKSGITFHVGNKRARPTVETWRTQFLKEGWKESATTLEAMAGTTSFTKGDQRLTVIYSDVGFIPAEVSIQAFGVELERATPVR